MSRKIIGAAGLALAALLFAAPAQALSKRTFVSGHGNDASDCSLTTPCRTLSAAFAATNPDGEIDILDPAGYGTLTITHGISIVNDGIGVASVLIPAGGTGITINAGVNDDVHLRGLTVEGAGVGVTGIKFNTGKSLTIVNGVIRHVTGDGIGFFPNASSKLSVSNALVADNGNQGIYVFPSGSGTVTAVFNRVEVNNNAGVGIFVYGQNSTGTVNATVAESVAAHNGLGFFAASTSGHAPTTLAVFHSVSANNGVGINADGPGATLRLAQSEVTGNSSGWSAGGGGGVIASYGDNYIDGNGANTGVLTPIVKQ